MVVSLMTEFYGDTRVTDGVLPHVLFIFALGRSRRSKHDLLANNVFHGTMNQDKDIAGAPDRSNPMSGFRADAILAVKPGKSIDMVAVRMRARNALIVTHNQNELPSNDEDNRDDRLRDYQQAA